MSEQPEVPLEDEEPLRQYSIDIESYRLQARSFITLASSRLCPGPHDKKALKSEVGILNTLKQCCSKKDDFMQPNSPLLEMVFRVFLANGNQPLTLEQLQERLQRIASSTSDTRDFSSDKLRRMIEADRYYGFGVALDDEARED